MTQEAATPQNAKISREFATRLASLSPKQKIRAIVMLQTGDHGMQISRRGASSEREAVLRANRQQVESALPDIDHVLHQFGGKRLSSDLDALGGISVETTVAGIRSLTSLDRVKAVLEDQGISVV